MPWHGNDGIMPLALPLPVCVKSWKWNAWIPWLGWDSLEHRRQATRLTLMKQIQEGASAIPTCTSLTPPAVTHDPADLQSVIINNYSKLSVKLMLLNTHSSQEQARIGMGCPIVLLISNHWTPSKPKPWSMSVKIKWPSTSPWLIDLNPWLQMDYQSVAMYRRRRRRFYLFYFQFFFLPII